MPPPEGRQQGQSPSVASTGCENCREQHLKCDRVTPTCGRCRLAARHCRRAGIKIRVAKNSFNHKQRWVKTPKRLVFIDETKEVSRDVEDQGLEEVEYDDDDDDDGEDTIFKSPSAVSDVQQRLALDALSASRSKATGLVVAPRSPTDRFIFHEDGHAHDATHQQSVAGSPTSRRVLVSMDGPKWPLTDLTEARLFRHFVQKLAIWLDVCDPRRSFETIVPQRVGTYPILLNAIFALAARHMSHISNFDPLVSNRYHQACLDDLIPSVNLEESRWDENLFAATIILRVLEEMEAKNMEMDNNGYLLGIHAYVKDGDRYLAPGGLSAACFWVGLRQEIYSAVMNQRLVRINLNHALVDRSLSPADDHTWANRAVVHCADVLNFCFGDDSQHRVARWQELELYGKRWSESIPSTFTPLYQDIRGVEAFPEIWHQSSCHAIGLQHHLLAELFLTRFDPKVPRIGANRKTAEEDMTERIQHLVRRVCGIGLGNQWTPPSMFTACMAIATFGDHFYSSSDKEAMLEILKKTEQDHARPTESVQHMCR